ncbi:MAG: hypothetical protein E6Q98_15830 [Rhodospirillaceae bacterium]|nr:MAG: hypothetical protein E6Q98_15830 [Rhodospirillaceae bacterium]
MNAPVQFGKISKPGFYDLPMDEYHGQCCIGPSVSGSGLVMIEQKSLAHFWQQSSLNPNATPKKDTPALRIGQAAHTIILEGEEKFRKTVVVKPEGHDGRTKEGKAWLAEHAGLAEAGTPIISHDDWLMLKAMAASIAAHPLARQAFADGSPEKTCIWQDSQTGIYLKTRPDWFPSGSRFFPNYKTTRNARPDKFERDAFDLGYHQGAALCIDILTALGIDNPIYFFVAQEKEPPYVTTVATMKDAALDWGRLQNRHALDRLHAALDAGEWPGYSEGVVEIDMPAYIERRLDQRHESGQFTNTVVGV